ncbi:MAG: hypothetical protein AAF639_26825 [Chloroflexota bacterium]
MQGISWWTQQWLEVLVELSLLDEVHLDKKTFSGSRVQRLEVVTGQIQAKVRDRELGTSTITIVLEPLTDAEWDRALHALQNQTLLAPQLLTGALPTELESIFVALGSPLFPFRADQLQITLEWNRSKRKTDAQEQVSADTNDTDEIAQDMGPLTITATSPERAIRPLLAVYHTFGDMLETDPWLLLRFRGRDRQQIMQVLNQRRTNLPNSGRSTQADVSSPPSSRSVSASKPSDGPTKPPERTYTNQHFTDRVVTRTSTGHAAAIPQSSVQQAARNNLASAGQAVDALENDAALEQGPQLANQIDTYWGSTSDIEHFQPHIAPVGVELTLLRSVGPPLFSGGATTGRTGDVPQKDQNELIYDHLVEIYREVTTKALELAYAAPEVQ